jgi:thioredoxin
MRINKLTMVLMIILLSITACVGSGTKKTVKVKENNNMKVIHLTKEEFLKRVSNYEATPNQWKYEGDVPCIVDFYATWCGPCKMLAPIMDSLATEYDGKLIIYKVDVDQEEDLAQAFGVSSIPTLLWVPKKGDPFYTRGAMLKGDLNKIIKEKLLLEK